MPELLEGWGVEQNQYHAFTVYEHSLRACDAAPAGAARATPGGAAARRRQPRTKEGPHFYGHEKVGADMTRALLKRLRFGGDLVDRVTGLVANHMYTTADAVSDAGVRRFIKRVGPENVDDLFELRHADVEATGLPPHDGGENQRFEARVRGYVGGRPRP